MKNPSILSRYIISYFLKYLFAIILVSFSVIFLIEFLGSLRRFYSKGASFYTVLEISFMNTPLIIQQIMLIIVLVAGMLTFLKLSYTFELVVARSMGFSVWNFILPVATTAFFFGIIFILVINPIVANMYDHFLYLESKYSHKEYAGINKDIWFKQSNSLDDKKVVVHIKGIDKDNLNIKKISFFIFKNDNKFEYRVDSNNVEPLGNDWKMKNAIITNVNGSTEIKKEYIFFSKLHFEDLSKLYKAPEAIPFLELPKLIDILKTGSIEHLKHVIAWHSILSSPFSYFVIIFVSAVFSFRFSNRANFLILFLIAGFLAGLGIKFFYNVSISFADFNTFAPSIAVWFPIFIVLFLSIYFILINEER